jgi:hypothetical protein
MEKLNNWEYFLKHHKFAIYCKRKMNKMQNTHHYTNGIVVIKQCILRPELQGSQHTKSKPVFAVLFRILTLM